MDRHRVRRRDRSKFPAALPVLPLRDVVIYPDDDPPPCSWAGRARMARRSRRPCSADRVMHGGHPEATRRWTSRRPTTSTAPAPSPTFTQLHAPARRHHEASWSRACRAARWSATATTCKHLRADVSVVQIAPRENVRQPGVSRQQVADAHVCSRSSPTTCSTTSACPMSVLRSRASPASRIRCCSVDTVATHIPEKLESQAAPCSRRRRCRSRTAASILGPVLSGGGGDPASLEKQDRERG